MKHLNFKFKEQVFLKKSAVGKKIEDLKSSDLKPWVRKMWWEKTCAMYLEEDGKIVESEKLQQHFWDCLYNVVK